MLQVPSGRLATIEAAGQAQVPFTSGILVSIGETQADPAVVADLSCTASYDGFNLNMLQVPSARLATIEAAGQAQVPFTSGILVGIGEIRAERVEALLAIKALHQQYNHIQVRLAGWL